MDGLLGVTRSQARALGASGRMAQALRLLGPAIETVVARHAGSRARLRCVLPRSGEDLTPLDGAGFEGVVARMRAQDPPLGILVMAPASLCRAMAGSVLGTGGLEPFVDPVVLESVIGLLVADVLRCLPAELPLIRLDAITYVRTGDALPRLGCPAVLFIRVRTGGITDLVTVVMAEDQLEAFTRSWTLRTPPPPAVLGLRYPLAIVCGWTRLDAGALPDLCEGDVIILDRIGRGFAAVARPEGRCDLAAPGPRGQVFVASAELHATGLSVVRAGPFIMEGDMDRDDERTFVDGAEDAPAGLERARASVRGLPAEVIVEAGRVSVSVGELLGLVPGTVIALERPVSAEVTLTAGGRPLAHAVLVNVEGELGVQVLKMID